MRRLAVLVALVCVPTALLLADEPISGPQVGKLAPGFEVLIATGDQAGKKLDQLGSLKDKPVLVIFWGEVTRPAFALLKHLDAYGRLRQPEGLQVLIVRLSDDTEAVVRHSKILNENYDIKSPIGVATAGKAGPMEYGLHDRAAMTVLLLDKEHKVLHNTARQAPERQDFKAVREAIDKLLGPSPVTFTEK